MGLSPSRPAVRLAALLWLVVAGTAVCAQPDPEPDAIESGRRALDGKTAYPWYDAEKDAIRRIDVETPKESAVHRNSNWQASPPRPASLSGGSWIGSLLKAILYFLFWAAMCALLVAVVVLLARAYLNMRSPAGAGTEVEQEPDASGEADLIENLPFRVKRPATDLLSEARRHYEQGEFGEAIIYLFSYQLVQLDRHHLIRLTRGKTNRQYLREMGPRPGLQEIFERTMFAFEDVFFGHHGLDRARFETCWSRLDEFLDRVEKAAI